MANQTFNDAGINDFFEGATDSALDSFVNEMKSDFDTAIANRFQLDSKYQSALKDTSKEMKEFLTDSVAHYVSLKQIYGSGKMTITGISGDGNPIPPTGLKVDCTLWPFHCHITFTKD